MATRSRTIALPLPAADCFELVRKLGKETGLKENESDEEGIVWAAQDYTLETWITAVSENKTNVEIVASSGALFDVLGALEQHVKVFATRLKNRAGLSEPIIHVDKGEAGMGVEEVGVRAKDSRPMFLYISTTRLVLMTIASFGVFGAYWIYKNWKYLNEKNKLHLHPFWRGMFGVFFCHSLLKAIENDADARKIHEARFFAYGLATGWVALTLINNVLVRASLLAGFIGILACLFFIPVQNYINDINKSSNPSAAYSEWSAGQVVCLIYGGICWLGLFAQLSRL